MTDLEERYWEAQEQLSDEERISNCIDETKKIEKTIETIDEEIERTRFKLEELKDLRNFWKTKLVKQQ